MAEKYKLIITSDALERSPRGSLIRNLDIEFEGTMEWAAQVLLKLLDDHPDLVDALNHLQLMRMLGAAKTRSEGDIKEDLTKPSDGKVH